MDGNVYIYCRLNNRRVLRPPVCPPDSLTTESFFFLFSLFSSFFLFFFFFFLFGSRLTFNEGTTSWEQEQEQRVEQTGETGTSVVRSSTETCIRTLLRHAAINNTTFPGRARAIVTRIFR